jgi:hypothetical protein
MTTQHNHAPRFGRKFDGCPRCDELKADARRALAGIGTPAGARILRVVRTDDVLTVVTEQPAGYFPYCVDSFRLPTPAETDPEQVDPCPQGRWILADQLGDHAEDQVERMIEQATAYAATIREAVA